MSDSSQRMLSVSTHALLHDDDNLVIHLQIPTPSPLSVAAATEYAHFLNREIRAICDAQVPSGDDRVLLAPLRPEPDIKIFTEHGNDLSKILWIRWPERG